MRKNPIEHVLSRFPKHAAKAPQPSADQDDKPAAKPKRRKGKAANE